ncbi:MAG: hypothetical protein LUC19_04975 [Oscillospiraceae bacterium]|nr:hypothetical protein [Oscillospiraceae bacterium]MCD8192113.1 hypothetical protein [Oscillospiraceae bacterium]MCD8343724.1 hypothetical protein [Oscillospiraceae bacterium]MCD8374477.1 hypothetical protein [Oscillospiraceae bacterium]
MTTSEKAAYLKGLIDGMNIDAASEYGKLFTAIADILNDLALDYEELAGDVDDISEELDAIDESVADIQDLLLDDDEDDDDYVGCRGCRGGEWDDEEAQFYEVTCPECGNTITVDEDIFDMGRCQCPNCGEMMEFDEPVDEESED